MVNCLYHSSLSANLKFFCSSNLLGVKIFVWYYAQCFFILCFLKDKILREFQILFIFILASGTVDIVVVLGVKYRRKRTEPDIYSVAQALSGVCCCMWWADWNSVLRAPHWGLHLLLCRHRSSEKGIAFIQRWKDCTFPAVAYSSDSFSRTHTSNTGEVSVDAAASRLLVILIQFQL